MEQMFYEVKNEMFHSTGLCLIEWKIFHFSPHENICSIALINIHYLYVIIRCKAASWTTQQDYYGLQYGTLLHNYIALVPTQK